MSLHNNVDNYVLRHYAEVYEYWKFKLVVHTKFAPPKMTLYHGVLMFSYYLMQEYLQEPLTASVHMIHTLCLDQDTRKTCIDTLGKYV